MKNYRSITLLATIFLFFLVATSTTAQENKKYIPTKISYNVPFGPVYPIEGESNQLDGKIKYDDETGQLKKVSFDVQLNSFFGQNSGYLSWIGNSFRNPNMSFNGRSITQKEDGSLTVKGSLNFRRQSSPLSIDFTRKDVGNEIVLHGRFNMRTGDYFIGPLNRRLVPMQIPFEVTLVFDKPIGQNDDLISYHAPDIFVNESS